VLRLSTPQTRDAIARTLAFFDPLHHANSIAAATLVSLGDAGALGGAEWLDPLVHELKERAETYQLTHEGRTDHDWLDTWLARRLA
jgi:hypothetical protein